MRERSLTPSLQEALHVLHGDHSLHTLTVTRALTQVNNTTKLRNIPDAIQGIPNQNAKIDMLLIRSVKLLIFADKDISNNSMHVSSESM